MQSFPPEIPPSPHADAVLAIWQANGLRPQTIQTYCRWVTAFFRYCARRGVLRPEQALTRQRVERFAVWCARSGETRSRYWFRATALGSLHAWSSALSLCGVSVPAWRPEKPAPLLSPLLAAFAEHWRRTRAGSAPTLRRHIVALQAFFVFLRERGRARTRFRVTDVDDYVVRLRERYSKGTVALVCSSIREYMRFLHATGRVRQDLSGSLASPQLLRNERPRRALPWGDVRAILREVDRTTRRGRRSFAILLLMAAYGLGAGEVFGLELGDIDWARARLRVRRPKTGVEIELPLLPAVARALLDYLEDGRPKHAPSRAVFVGVRSPHDRVQCGAAVVGELLRRYARAAGTSSEIHGSHVLRHSHATRQIELGATPKVVADILGHRSASSTTGYVRVALQRLRGLALPVPR
jgi:integrase/recombinase XerD